jgi:uncharacterized phiE125 gp8 family phage protein
MIPRTTLKTAPTVEPVTKAEIKQHLRLDGSEDDGYLDGLIAAARKHAETATGRALITQTWYARLDGFPRIIRLPWPTLQTVTAVTYIDSNGTTQTLAATEYTVNTYSEPGTIIEAYGKSWPSTRDVENCVTVEYTCGYGATAASVPEGIRHAIKMLVAHWYRVREPIITGTIVADTPMAVDMLLNQYNHGWQW